MPKLPPALARWLADRGDHAEHVFDIGRVDAAAGVIWRRALDTSAVIVTKDEDFAVRVGLTRCASSASSGQDDTA